MPNYYKPPTPDPSEDEIRRDSEQIQATWSKSEERRRRMYETPRVELEPQPSRELFGEEDQG